MAFLIWGFVASNEMVVISKVIVLRKTVYAESDVRLVSRILSIRLAVNKIVFEAAITQALPLRMWSSNGASLVTEDCE